LNVRNIVEALSPEKMPIAPVEGKRSREASEVSGIPYVMEADREEASRILRDGQRLRHPRPARERASVGPSLDQGIPS